MKAPSEQIREIKTQLKELKKEIISSRSSVVDPINRIESSFLLNFNILH